MKNLNDIILNPDDGHITLEKEEVQYLYDMYERYISESYHQIEGENDTAIDKAQAVYDHLGSYIEYYWYIYNYIKGFELDEKGEGSTNYGLELNLKNAENMAKVIYSQDTEGKLKHIVDSESTLSFYYQNLKSQ